MEKILNEDISLAQQIVSRKTLPARHVFSDISGIYKGTNEFITNEQYQEALKNKTRILSVLGSGDQIINSILFGSKDIEGFDISRFPKYYLMLKLAAIKSLSKDEYLSFLFGDIHDELYNEDMYSKIYPYLDEDTRLFWDSLFDYFDVCEINDSMLFRSDIMNKGIMVNNNPYLQGDNFERVKSNLKGIDIKFHEGNIFTMFNGNTKGFDLINLSNIIHYYKCVDKDYSGYKSFLDSLPLNEKGLILSYLIGYDTYWNDSGVLDQFDEEHYKIEEIKRDKGSDGLILYKRKGLRDGKHNS